MEYNATAILPGRYAKLEEDAIDEILDEVSGFHPALSAGEAGEPELVITLQAENLSQAVDVARSLVSPLGPVGLEVVPTELWDRRVAAVQMPALVSVTGAAERLGVSRQAVLQRIESGSLPAVRVGTSWVLPAAGLAT